MTPLSSSGPFIVHMTDPPWKTRDKLPGKRGAAYKYKVMATSVICTMPTPIMRSSSVLLLWRISCMVEDAGRIARAWGYEPKAEIVWRKLRRCGPCDGSGKITTGGRGALVIVTSCKKCGGRGKRPVKMLGHHVRASHETCIIATRGRNMRLVKDVSSHFEGLMPEGANGKLIHSAKPAEFYDIVERLYPGPYVETFARNNRDGWVSLGDQVPEVIRARG